MRSTFPCTFKTLPYNSSLTSTALVITAKRALQIRGKPSPCFPQQTAKEVSVHYTTTEQSPLFFQITAVIRLLNTRCWSHQSSQGVVVQGAEQKGCPWQRYGEICARVPFPTIPRRRPGRDATGQDEGICSSTETLLHIERTSQGW